MDNVTKDVYASPVLDAGISLSSSMMISSSVIVASIAGASIFFLDIRNDKMLHRMIYFTISLIIGIIGAQSFSNYVSIVEPGLQINPAFSAFVCSAFSVKVVMRLYSRLDKV